MPPPVTLHHALGGRLYDAVYEEDIDEARVRSLLGQGADTNWRHPEYGSTPLYRAARNGHEVAVQLLLEHGALVDTPNLSGRTPLMTAAFHGHDGVVRVLLENGADAGLVPHKGAWTGKTALDLAIQEGKQDCVTLLERAARGITGPPDTDPRQWSVAEVSHWLVSNGMSGHVARFAAANVSGSELCVLTESDLTMPPLSLSPLQARAVLRYRDRLADMA